MDQYRRLSDTSDDSSASDHSMDAPPDVIKWLEKKGYTLKKELGRGASGIVFLVEDAEGDPYGLKKMNSRDVQGTTKKEVEILKSLNFGYIVNYVNSFEDKDAGHIYIVMDFCAGGDLSKIMETNNKDSYFEEKQILDWLVQICLALKYLHENNVLHRDVKPQNVFLTEDGYISLGDFGCSKVLRRGDGSACSNVVASLYSSPEGYEKKHNSKSDIWSLGWLLHDLCMLDVWTNKRQRHILHALSMAGTPPDISERYSEELRMLFRQMLSDNPKERPSAEEILAKQFLSEAVDRSSSVPQALEQRLMRSINAFDEAYDKHYKEMEVLVSEWGRITDSMESTHYSATAGSLSGSVIGAAGGITALVGVILSPFTLGASLIVTGVGIGVGVAGGVTGAASTITNTVQQNALQKSIEKIQLEYNSVSRSILTPLNTLRKVLKKIQKFSVYFDKAVHNVHISCNLNKGSVFRASPLMNLGVLGNVSRIVTQATRAGRVVAEAVSGVLSGLLVILDVTFIVLDSVDIHQMRQGKVDDPEKVKSSLLKSIAEMRKTHKELCNVQKEIQKTREELKDYIEIARDYSGIDQGLNCLNK